MTGPRENRPYIRKSYPLELGKSQKDYTRLLDLDTGENIVEFASRHVGDEFANGAFLESFFNIAALCRPE